MTFKYIIYIYIYIASFNNSLEKTIETFILMHANELENERLMHFVMSKDF